MIPLLLSMEARDCRDDRPKIARQKATPKSVAVVPRVRKASTYQDLILNVDRRPTLREDVVVGKYFCVESMQLEIRKSPIY